MSSGVGKKDIKLLIKYSQVFREINGGEALPEDVLDRWYSLGKQYAVAPVKMGEEWEAHAMSLIQPNPLDKDQIADFERLVIKHFKNKTHATRKTEAGGTAMTTRAPTQTNRLRGVANELTRMYGQDVKVVPKATRQTPRQPSQAGERGAFAKPPPRQRGSNMAGQTPRQTPRRGVQSSHNVQASPAMGTYAARNRSGETHTTWQHVPHKIQMRGTLTTNSIAREVVCRTIDPEDGLMQVLRKRRDGGNPLDKDRGGIPYQHRYMKEDFRNKVDVTNDRIVELAQRIKRRATGNGMDVDEKASERGDPNDESEFCAVDAAHQGSGWHCGRIVCDGEGKLNIASMLLEGDMDTSQGRRAKLNLSALPSFAVFPNQVVVVKGKNDSGQMILAEELHTNAALPKDRSPPLPQPDKLQVMVVVGPLSVSSTLAYGGAMSDFAQQARDRKADVVLLVGPFVDEKNELVTKDMCDKTYEEYQAEMLWAFIDEVKGCLPNGKSPQIFVVPSPTDLTCDCVFPQQPYPCPDTPVVKFVPNPSQLKIGGYTIGISSSDILFAYNSQATERKDRNDRRGRMLKFANHCIQQQHFYPLYPTDARAPLLDYNFHQDLQFQHTPDILILPSRLMPFADLGDENVVCLNPGTLTKGKTGGTYSILTLQKPPAKHGPDKHDLIRVDIMRI